MSTLKLLFVDFWPGFTPESNPLVDVLRKRFDVDLSSQPDFVIYSNFGYRHLDYDVPRLFYTGENLRPDFNVCDYALGSDRMTFGDRYFRFPTYMLTCQKELHEISGRTYVSRPRKFCNFVYSNPNADPLRDEFFRRLSKYKQVDSAGRHLNTTGFLVRDKTAFQKDYKFTIAFENSSTPGYSTEKIVHAYVAETVPIYWEDPDIGLDFNPGSFVNCHDLPNIDSVIERIAALDRDETEYAGVFEAPFLRRPLRGYAFEPGFEEFLVLTFSQDRDRAFRRNRQFWGRAYETQRRKLASYMTRLEENRWFSFTEHLRILGVGGTFRKLREKIREKRRERNAARLRDA